MPKYQDIKLYKLLLPESHPLAKEANELALMPSHYEPDRTKTFEENLKLKFLFDLRKGCLKEIKHIKAKFYKETGEVL